jgi:tripeptide aminopeptidase
MGSPLSRQLTHRFFRYLAITSQSDPKVKTLPSTPGQHDMARELAQELAQLGLDDIVIDEFATVTAVKKATCPARRASALLPILIPSTWDYHRIFIHKY